jgi:hypothetical protein
MPERKEERPLFYENDWVMRQINMLVQFAARVIFHKDTVEYDIEDESNLTDTDDLYLKIQKLLQEGKICKAEDLLFENRSDTEAYLTLALDFYQKLSKMSDEELEQHNFSRQEIYDGLKEVLFRFKGMPELPVEL